MAANGGIYQKLVKKLIEGDLDGDFKASGDFMVTMLHDGDVLTLKFYHHDKPVAKYVLTGSVGQEGTTGVISYVKPEGKGSYQQRITKIRHSLRNLGYPIDDTVWVDNMGEGGVAYDLFRDGGSTEDNYEIELFWKGLSDNRKVGKYVVSEKTLENLEDEYSHVFSIDVIDETNQKPISWYNLKKELFSKGKERGFFKEGGKVTAPEKFRMVMGEFRDGTLTSGSGDKVTDKDQAFAIAFSEARKIDKTYGRYADGGSVSYIDSGSPYAHISYKDIESGKQYSKTFDEETGAASLTKAEEFAQSLPDGTSMIIWHPHGVMKTGGKTTRRTQRKSAPSTAKKTRRNTRKKVDKWEQDVVAEMEEKGTIGAFTKQAKEAGMTTQEFARDVHNNPNKYTLRTRRRAQFMINANPELFPEIKKKSKAKLKDGGGARVGIVVQKTPNSAWEFYKDDISVDEAKTLESDLKKSGKYHDVMIDYLPFADGGKIHVAGEKNEYGEIIPEPRLKKGDKVNFEGQEVVLGEPRYFPYMNEWVFKLDGRKEIVGEGELLGEYGNGGEIDPDMFVVYGEDEEGKYKLISTHKTYRGAKNKLNKEWNKSEFDRMGSMKGSEWNQFYAPHSYAGGGYVSPHVQDLHNHIMHTYTHVIPKKDVNSDYYTYDDFAEDIKKVYNVEQPRNKQVYDYLKHLGKTKMFVYDDSDLVQEKMATASKIVQYKGGGEVELPNSNLYLVGKGRDVNGNRVVKIKYPNSRVFSIQSLGNLPNTHRILSGVDKASEVTDKELALIEKEVSGYIKEFGSKKQKEGLRTYAEGGYIDNMSKEDVLSQTIIYDNNGETLDRYTVFTPDGSVYGMSETASGFNQYIGDAKYDNIQKGSHLGKKLKSVPAEIEWAVLDRMKEEYAEGGYIGDVGGVSVAEVVVAKPIVLEKGGGLPYAVTTDPENDEAWVFFGDEESVCDAFDEASEYQENIEIYGLNDDAHYQQMDYSTFSEEFRRGGSVKRSKFFREDKNSDAKRMAKPKGYRFKGDRPKDYKKPTKAQIRKGLKTGKVYYEARPERSDMNNQARMMLESGGAIMKNGGSVKRGDVFYDVEGTEYEIVKPSKAGWVGVNEHGKTVNMGDLSDYSRMTRSYFEEEEFAYANGGETQSNGLNTVEVIFANPEYNYTTAVSPTTTEESARKYFVGTSFNVASYPKEQFEEVVDIKFTPNPNNKKASGKKKYYPQYNVGKAKYVMNFYDGEKTHKDGSEFYDMRTFTNKKDFIKFEKELIKDGYVRKHAEGGATPDFEWNISGYWVDVYEDNYDEGEGNQVNHWGKDDVNESIGNPEELFNFISNHIIYKDVTAKDFSVLDGRLETSILVDDDNSPASDNDIELWKQGKKTLYSANYNIDINMLAEKTPSDEEISKFTGASVYKEGGKTMSHKSRGKKDAECKSCKSHVLVSKTKDDYWVVMSIPTSESKAKELKEITTPVRGETLHVVKKTDVDGHNKVVGREYLMKNGGSTSSSEVSEQERENFVGYVYSFYGKKGGLYADDYDGGFTKDDIRSAVNQYLADENTTWGGGDSMDREILRDKYLAPMVDKFGDVYIEKWKDGKYRVSVKRGKNQFPHTFKDVFDTEEQAENFAKNIGLSRIKETVEYRDGGKTKKGKWWELFEDGGKINDEIHIDKFREVIGREPNYPYEQHEGRVLTKCFLRPYYKIVHIH